MTTADQVNIVDRKLTQLVRLTSTSVGSNDPLLDPKTGSSTLKALSLADGGLVSGWVKARRLCVLVEERSRSSPATQALVIFNSTSFPVSKPEDLEVETVLPMDAEFKCEIDSSDDVLLKFLAHSKVQLMVEMLPGYHTQNFVSEVFRLTEGKGAQKSSMALKSDAYEWIKRLKPTKPGSSESQPSAAGLDALSLHDKDSSNQQGIAAKSLLSDAERPVSAASGSSFGGSGADFAGGDVARLINEEDMEPTQESAVNRSDIAMGVTPIAARESVVKYQMAQKEDQFTTLTNFTVFCGTWNVNGQSPDAQVQPWLAPDEEPPDLYAIGFQELDLSKEAFVFNESVKEDEWKAIVFGSLHPGAKYKKVKLIRLVGMMLIVFVKESHAKSISNVVADTVGTGIMGKLGNKGGVAVRFEFHNTSICIVNSHLAAHVSEFERRNQDFHDICLRMNFIHPTTFSNLGIKDHDMIYWIGDLNYRITDLDAATVKEMLLDKEKNLPMLLASDQFRQQKFQRKVFHGYNEGSITFIPTYKFDTGTSNWDTSEKARAPAWTDRILWKGDHIDQLVYRSHMELKISDHKPVSAVFKAGMKVVDPVKYRKIYEDVMKKLDRLENEFLPQVTVETTEITFGEVKFFEPQNKTLTVANTGQVPVQFEFIKKLNDSSICKPWLTIEPTNGFIMPGEKSDIEIEVAVSKKTAGELTSGSDQMYDILVLHLIGGKDIFITVSGEYVKSSFGASISALCRMTVPIAELSVKQLVDLEKGQVTKAQEEEEPYPVPKELWFLCDLITTLGMGQEQIFMQPGLRSEILSLRDWLDTGLPVDRPAVSIHSAAETLLLFLESLREPIVPYKMYSRCLDASANYLQCKQIASQLPEHHKHVFNYMTAFLREVIRHSAQNGIDPKILATLFAGIFLRDPPGTNLGTGLKARTNQQLLEHRKGRFVYHFLVNEPED